MKKHIILAILLVGAGISGSKADSAFGSYAGSHRSGGYATPVYVQPDYGHQDLHRDLRQERQQLDWEIRQAREALERELKQDKAYGVPEWQRKIKRASAKDHLKEWRRGEERQLRRVHSAAHDGLRW